MSFSASREEIIRGACRQLGAGICNAPQSALLGAALHRTWLVQTGLAALRIAI